MLDEEKRGTRRNEGHGGRRDEEEGGTEEEGMGRKERREEGGMRGVKKWKSCKKKQTIIGLPGPCYININELAHRLV